MIGPYALAFFSLVLGHQWISERHPEGPLTAAYLVDCGFGHYDQLVEVHRVILGLEIAASRELGDFRHTGSLTQDSDDRVPPLQAADAIAWVSRKVQLTGTVPKGFEPLLDTLRDRGPQPLHVTVPVDLKGIRMLANPINRLIAKNGKLPTLADVFVRRQGSFVIRLKT